MQSRFVIVPVLQAGNRFSRSGLRIQSDDRQSGFDIYDNQEKARLAYAFKDRTAAEAYCKVMNSERIYTDTTDAEFMTQLYARHISAATTWFECKGLLDPKRCT